MTAGVIDLNFINRSGDTNNSSVVIFQQNVAADFGEIVVAWKVIQNCGRGYNHPFLYPLLFDVSASDSYGNYTPQLAAYDGQRFDMKMDSSGVVLQHSDQLAASSNEVEIANELPRGAINANVFRDGKLCACKTNIIPGQKASFAFQPRIYIGVVSQIEEGSFLDAAVISQITTEISLFGIMSADIVMTGGGACPSAMPFAFDLQNIKA